MTNQTGEWGLRLEELYEQCMALSPEKRDAFVEEKTRADPAMAAQLRLMIKLEDPTAANPLATTPSAITPPTNAPPPSESASGGRGVFELTGGTEFGRCRVVNGYGFGGMGTVYLASDLENHNRPVALKVMKPHFLRPQDRQRFTIETAALARLVHPNIARLYYWGIQPWQGNPRPFLVMEFVDGSTLGKYLAETKPPLRQVLTLLRKICLAAHYGHLQGVFHRDLKPSNILVTPDGEPKLIDFGVSFTVDKDKTSNGMAGLEENVGTPAYMAPEVAGRRPYQADARTDVYSLGVIAFEALTGRRPGAVGPGGAVQSLDLLTDKSEARRLIAERPRERLRTAHRRFGRDLDCIVAKSLSLEMGGRYSDADKLAEDLQRLMDLETVRARPQTRRYSARMFVRRNRLAVTAGVLIFTAILAAAVIFRVGEVRVRAALVEIKRQDAAAHARAAELAEQRGNWTAAADEYRQAQEAGYPDRLKLAVGQLRALDRLGRTADADALINDVHRTYPQIAGSPRFEIVEGFYKWTSKPDESVKLIEFALKSSEQLPPADRSFALALTAADIPTAAVNLRQTVREDPFNHDGLALLTLCDLTLGETAQGEADGMLMQRLYPQDATGSVLAAFACALGGRGAAASAHLAENPTLPEKLRSGLRPTIDFIVRNHSLDEMQSQPARELFSYGNRIASIVGLPSILNVRLPKIFQWLGPASEPNDLSRRINTPGAINRMMPGWPNGDGAYAAGLLALEHRDFQSAEDDFRAAMSAPAPVDCRRNAAMYLLETDAHDPRMPHDPGTPGAATVKVDLDRLLDLGGVNLVRNSQESIVLETAAQAGLYWQLRKISMAWLSDAPDDPRAMYYVALAESHLGRTGTAIFFYEQALDHGLEKEMADKARAFVADFKAAAATTRPA